MGICESPFKTYQVKEIQFETDVIPLKSHYENEFTTRYNNIDILKPISYKNFTILDHWES
jgi:hypothetical protein